MASEVKTNKISPSTGVTVTLGDASDVFQLPASAEIDIASGATLDVNGTIDVTGATVTGLSAGKVLQVLQPTPVTSNTLTTTSTSFVDITGVTVDITPSATSSKILVLFNMMIGCTGGWHAHVRLVRDSTAIGIGAAYSARKQSTSEASAGHTSMANPVPGIFLDSPSTTSATTYKLQWATESSGTIWLNRALINTDNLNFGTFISTITVMEIGV